jgi:acyl carrier protein
VDLARTRELFTRSRSASPCSAGGDTGEAVLAVAAEVFQAPEGRVEARWGPEELPRWDSFGHLAFVVELESRFSVRFSTAEILGIKELSDAQRLVLEKLGR